MPSLKASIFTSTIGKIEKMIIRLDKEGASSIFIKLHPVTDVNLLIQAVCLKFANDEKSVLEASILSLINEAGLSINETIAKAKEAHFFEIPIIRKDIQLLDSTRIKYYIGSYGRIISKKFELQ